MLKRRIIYTVYAIVMSLYITVFPARVVQGEGLTLPQKRIYGKNIHWFDVSECSTSPTEATDTTGGTLDSQVSDVASKHGLHSAMIREIGNGNKSVGAYNAEHPPITPASTMKLVIVDTLLQSGKDLNDSVNVTSDLSYGGTYDLSGAPGRVKISDIITATLSVSSNTGANALVKAMGGPSGFSDKAHRFKYPGTTMQAYYSPSAGHVNKSTTSDQTLAMAHIFTSTGEGYQVAQSALETAASGDNYYNVADAEANKWAGTTEVAGNVAMFTVNAKKYAVGVYYEGSSGSDTSKTAVREGTADLVDLLKNVSSVPSAGGCCSGAGAIAVNGSISPQAGKGMSPDAQQKFQQYAVAAGNKNGVNPNFVASFYYTEMGRTGDSTNNADAASGTPVTGDGNWIEPAPPVGHGDPYVINSLGYAEPLGWGSYWSAYGQDGDGDGVKDRQNLADALFGTANNLAANGAKEGASDQKLKDAAYLYNHSDTYAQSVLNTYKYLIGKGSSDVSGSTGGCGGEAVVGDGSVQAAVDAAKKLSDYAIPYSQACRTMKKIPPSCGYDCSASVSWVLLTAGFPLPNDVTWGGWAPVSGDFVNWGDPGKGNQMTVWANDGHVFIEFNVPGVGHYQLNTAGWGGSGPHYFKWGYPTDGFTARHWPGT